MNTTQSLHRIDATLRTTAISAAILFAAWLFKDILLLAFAAILLACILRLAGNRLSKATGIAPTWSLAIVITTLLVVTIVLAWWRGPQVVTQAVDLGDQLKTDVTHVWDRVGQTSWGSRIAGQLRDVSASSLSSATGFLTSVASSTFGIGGSLLLIGISGLFLAIAPQTYIDGSVRLLPPTWRTRARSVLESTGEALQLWFVGQLVDMLLVTILTAAGLFLLGSKLFVPLALFAGLMNFVPFIGALVGAIPAILVALDQSPTQAAWVAGLFLIVQTLEGNLIAPLIQKRTVELPPAITIFSQTVLGTLFGALGLILATPVMAAILVIVRMCYVESVLEAPSPITKLSDTHRTTSESA